MKWITREKVKVDRVACPWLIKKFIDPKAEFIFVPADQGMSKPVGWGKGRRHRAENSNEKRKQK